MGEFSHAVFEASNACNNGRWAKLEPRVRKFTQVLGLPIAASVMLAENWIRNILEAAGAMKSHIGQQIFRLENNISTGEFQKQKICLPTSWVI